MWHIINDLKESVYLTKDTHTHIHSYVIYINIYAYIHTYICIYIYLLTAYPRRRKKFTTSNISACAQILFKDLYEE